MTREGRQRVTVPLREREGGSVCTGNTSNENSDSERERQGIEEHLAAFGRLIPRRN